jgi:cysteine desulfurase/selenocysteine lyase
MPPYHAGSNMAHAVDFESAEIEEAALKFQAGTPDVAGPVGLAAAVRFFDAAGAAAIAKQDRTLVEHGLERLPQINGLRIVGPTTPEHRAPVFTFTVEGHSPEAIARALDAKGIAIRAGDLAALPLLRRFGLTAAARASAYLYSTTDDIDRLCEALRSLNG